MIHSRAARRPSSLPLAALLIAVALGAAASAKGDAPTDPQAPLPDIEAHPGGDAEATPAPLPDIEAHPDLGLPADSEGVAVDGFVGPAAARNFQPIQLIFLQLPFERPGTVGDGHILFEVESAESNVIATTQGYVESVLKFETNRTVFNLRYGLTDRWEVGIHMPFITRYGGYLDPFIDFVEDVFGADNPERDFFPKNSFGAFTVQRPTVSLFEGGKETFQPGDLWISSKFELPLDIERAALSVRGAIKMPTGNADSVLGSGEPDFGIGLTGEYQPFDRLMLFLNLNVIYPVGPITDGNMTLNPFLTTAFGAELRVFDHWSALLHQAYYMSPMHGTDTNLLDAGVVELGLGINFAWSKALAFQILAIQNVSGVEQSADFTLMLATRYWR
jgi:hypothetical protein